MHASPTLFQPISVGSTQLEHRVVMAPLTRFRANDDYVPSDMAAEYYTQRATKGGLLITEATLITEESGGYKNVPGIWSKAHIAKWKEITDAVHAEGGKFFMQLWALGRVGSLDVVPTLYSSTSKPDLSAEGSDPKTAPKITPMTEQDIDRFVGDYKQAALNAIEAGFDGVEIHGANGYLLDQFLQPWNDREDNYGGSVENRMRFPLRVLNEICEAIGAERTAIRLSPFSTFQGTLGDHKLETFLPVTQAIVKAQPKLAYIHTVQSRVVGNDMKKDASAEEMADDMNPIRDAAAAANIPMIIAGNFDPESGIRHSDETGDLIAYGRHYIPNPDLVDRIRNDKPLEPYNRDTFYAGGAEGYITYKTYAETKVSA